jgi:hypothetical protein
LDSQEPVKGISIRDDEDAHNRQRIRRAVLEGDIDRAMKYTDAYYPAVLRDNEQVYFRLRCRKFIEMIRKEAEHNIMLEERGAIHTNGRGQATSDNDEEMLEAEPGHNAFHGTATTTNGDGDMDMAEAGEGAGGSDSAAGLSKLSQEALLYGVELQAEFAGDSRRETVKQLDDISSLFAYPNPLKVKEVAHLLDGSGRVAVAEELNSAILSKPLPVFYHYPIPFPVAITRLYYDVSVKSTNNGFTVSLGKSSRAALENVYAQTCVLLESLRKDGGDGAFVTVGNVVRDIPPSRLR